MTEPEIPEISVVVSSFNRVALVLDLLADLRRQRDVRIETIVVDDVSSDNTVEAIQSGFPEVRVFRNDRNSGPCVSRNRGIRHASAPLVVGLDSDVTFPDDRVLARVRDRFVSAPPMTAFAFRVLASDGQSDDGPRWYHPRPITSHADREFETDYFSGTAWAFRRTEIEAVGLFPEAIFQYYEEVEVTYRFLDAGGRVLYAPELAVKHHTGTRSGWTDHRFYHTPRSQILLAVACLPAARATWFLSTRLGMSLVRAIGAGKLGPYVRGVRSGIRDGRRRADARRPLKKDTWRRIRELRAAGAER